MSALKPGWRVRVPYELRVEVREHAGGAWRAASDQELGEWWTSRPPSYRFTGNADGPPSEYEIVDVDGRVGSYLVDCETPDIAREALAAPRKLTDEQVLGVESSGPAWARAEAQP